MRPYLPWLYTIQTFTLLVNFASGVPTQQHWNSSSILDDYDDLWPASYKMQQYGVVTNMTALLNPANHSHKLPPVPTPQQMELDTNKQFELLKINYSRLLSDIDGDLREDLRSGRHLPRIVDKALRLFDLKQVMEEVETSVMSKVSCTACKADACGDVYNPTHEWKVVFPPVQKPDVTPQKAPSPGAPTFKVLHLSDTHFDPYYQEGTNADCKEPLCCRLTNGPALSPHTAAGRWGDYRKCDTPKRTVDHMLQHISSTHPDIDYILWTGDLPPHDVWNQTREENLMVLKETTAQMMQTFPGIPIFPALGNHESAPVNSFPPPFVKNDFGISWLYDELDAQWRQWLPTSVSHTVRRGAFYSVLVRPGFRIISLNMNYCNNKNWWLLLNSTDPAKELQWFIYELQSAEFNGEKVHVIGHIPPGHSDCLKVWSRNYFKIINR
uniref:Calcineurin-like phosphoesterase domain-containing protein n=1 Tax=Timema monikensis TaxID=170555 RepID=A0A7R9HMI9_9NEOP|nr:unnamed protein product [Timema monikensis]